MAAAGTVTETARRAFEETLADDPTDPRSRYYLGLAEAQAGRTVEALETWQALVHDSPPGAAWLPGLTAAIAELGGAPAGAGDAAAPAIGTGDAAMILGMVQRLAERLAERLEREPADVDGWLRLAQSYDVLGEPDLAAEARRRSAAAAASGTAEQRAAVAAALAAAGRDVPQPPTEPAAPDDLAGWVRIAQTHLAFGRPVQAKAAFAEAIARPGPSGATRTVVLDPEP